MKNSFTESSSSEIIEDSQVISEKYYGQKDIDIGEILSKNDGGGITFDDNLRINLRNNHFKPDKNFEFPRKLLHGCKRSFSHNLAYSRYLDALFCLPCVLYSKSKKTILRKFQISVNGTKQVRKLKNIAVLLFMIEACQD